MLTRWVALALGAAASALVCGCLMQQVDMFPEPNANESARVARLADQGVVLATFASYPLRDDTPPDGVRAAMLRAIGGRPCSAATFYWSERALALRWIREQLELRRRNGWPPRLILAGHGLGATEASETAYDILREDTDVEIVLLLTVDAVKTGRIGSAAAVTGAATVGRIPGVNLNFTAYDAGPQPDGRKLWAHVNYYQTSSPMYSGAPMMHAENHHLEDWTGVLTHGSSDDFAMPLVAADLRAAIARGSR
ncbi:MAG: hypothetical protein LIP23_02795 [Planctomycetes bacterium]|nr:hypothetical protein [Planctomycetota bacterium]